MTLTYEKLGTGRNDWFICKVGSKDTIDMSLVEYMRVEEDIEFREAVQQIAEDDGLDFNRIDIEVAAIAIGILNKWYEAGELLPPGRYRMNSGYMVRVYDEPD